MDQTRLARLLKGFFRLKTEETRYEFAARCPTPSRPRDTGRTAGAPHGPAPSRPCDLLTTPETA